MGLQNLRAICPNCGGKIHTQPKGLGHFTWANSWMLVQTGLECQHCGVAFSGKVAASNKAILAEDAEKTWWERETGTTKSSTAVAQRPSEGTPLGPELPAESKQALLIDFEQPGVDAAELFAALHRGILKLGYRLIKSDSQDRRFLIRTPWSMEAGRLKISVRVLEEPDCTVLRVERPRIPLLAWGKKNTETRRLVGATLSILEQARD